MKEMTAREAWDLTATEAQKWQNGAFTYAVSQRGISAPRSWDKPSDAKVDLLTGKSSRWMVEFSKPDNSGLLFVEVLDGIITVLPEAATKSKRLDLGTK